MHFKVKWARGLGGPMDAQQGRPNLAADGTLTIGGVAYAEGEWEEIIISPGGIPGTVDPQIYAENQRRRKMGASYVSKPSPVFG